MDSDEDQRLPAHPPCRAAERYVTACPVCAREVTIKTLRYSHVCGRSFDEAARATEQQAAAHAAVLGRTGPVAQVQTQRRSAAAPVQTHPADERRRRWEQLPLFSRT
jgi:hypothetical protein